MPIPRRSLLTAGLLAGTAGLAGAGFPRIGRAQTPVVIKLGHIVDTSGPLKGVSGPSVAAVDMAEAKINATGGVNGHPVKFIRYESGSDPRQAGIAARKLIEDDGVMAIAGPFSSGEVAVAMNDAERSKVTMIPIAASRPGLLDGKKYLWRLAADEGTQLTRVIGSMKRKGIQPKTAEIMYISDEAIMNDAGTKTFAKVLDAFGIKYGEPIGFQYKSFDLSPQVAKAMQSKPDVIAVASTPEAAARVLHEMRRQNYQGRMIGSQLWSDPIIMELFGKDSDGTMFEAGFWRDSSPEAAAFNTEFMAENKQRGVATLGAFHTDALSYDVPFLLRQAMTKAGVTGDPAKLAAERIATNDAMHGIIFSGVVGKDICFKGQDGQLPGYTIQMENAQFTLFDEWPAASCS